MKLQDLVNYERAMKPGVADRAAGSIRRALETTGEEIQNMENTDDVMTWCKKAAGRNWAGLLIATDTLSSRGASSGLSVAAFSGMVSMASSGLPKAEMTIEALQLSLEPRNKW
jgi:hypothetical protein